MSKKIKFQSIVLDHARPLGSGYYGNTYHAHADHLLCAGKHMTPELFEVEPNESGWGASRRKKEGKIKKSLITAFVHEIDNLRRVCHPHLVQYLGSHVDADSGLPVVLMELCQENLTCFLDRSHDSLAYHKQVGLLHDLALALVFLHAHGIVHGNLSSNNVFIVPYHLPRAKVSDYGICRMSSIAKYNSAYYRGNSAYVPPDPITCLQKNGTKVDCYSWGVLATQILTNQLPLPPPKLSEQVKGEQPMNIEEHHKTILALVNSSNPLLPIVKSALRQLDGHRPPSDVISYSLAELKADRIYLDSAEREQKHQQPTHEQKSMSGASKLKKELRESKIEVERLKKELFGAGKKKSQPVLRPTFSEDDSGERRAKTMHRLDFSRSERDEEHVKRLGTSVPLLESNNYLHDSSNREILSGLGLEEEQEEGGSSGSRGGGLESVGEAEATAVAGAVGEEEWTEETDAVDDAGPTLRTGTPGAASKKKRWSLLRKSSTLPEMQTHFNTPTLTVRVGTSALSATIRGYSAVDEEGKAFFASFSSSDKRIYTCKVHRHSKNLSWLVIPECPHFEFGLALVNNAVTAVGGYKQEYRPSQPTNCLLTYSEIRRQWTERFPPMLSKRRLPAVVTTRSLLVVAGGNGDRNELLATVEVMNMQTLTWATTVQLPMALTHASATVLDNCIHIAGGQNATGPTNAHFLSNITCTPGIFSKEELSPWKKSYKTPTLWCTLAAVSGRLLALGGQDDHKTCSNSIFMYDLRSDVWVKVGNMRHKRSACLAAVPNGEGYGGMMVVVGGFVRKNEATNAAEVITCTSN